MIKDKTTIRRLRHHEGSVNQVWFRNERTGLDFAIPEPVYDALRSLTYYTQVPYRLSGEQLETCVEVAIAACIDRLREIAYPIRGRE